LDVPYHPSIAMPDPEKEKEPGGLQLDLATVPTLYAWIRKNFLMFIGISVCLLALFGAYQFIMGFAKDFGTSIATQHEDLKRAVASYTALDTIIEKPLERFNASRVGLFRFHDSEQDISRMAFFFVSVANMVAAPGVALDLPQVTNLPASTFASILPTLIEQQPMLLHVKTMVAPNTLALKELEVLRGARIVLFIPIDDLRDNMIGFLQVEWLSEEDLPSGDDQAAMIKSLTDDAARISGYFSLSPLSDDKARKNVKD
jgi:hypothetical protein